ncbi:MAG TPA: biopolymer transporter ExbD [Methylomirabilota bacterium]|nr:biopolymer transporter ExbD [Methylomirabilota bacterium]
MPVKLGSKLPPENEARIEIIPLIDIMFFLLAAFMLVSLSMVNQKNIPVNLPTAAAATPETRKDIINITVDKAGIAYMDSKAIGKNELAAALAALQTTNGSPRVMVSGDRDARHGDVISVLDVVRGSGIEKIAFEIREATAAQ